jgi:NADH-quinone oxidoreductase subunit N
VSAAAPFTLAAAEIGKFTKPEIDWAGFAPLLAVLGGATIILMVSLIRSRFVQHALVPALAIVALGAAIGLAVANWNPGDTTPIVTGALAIDTLAYGIAILCCASGIVAILLAWRSDALREAGAGEFACLLLGSVGGMILLAGAENLVTLFIGLELLSIPLYVLCGSRVREEKSLEAGLKYLIVGSLGSATLLYGMALLYGATGSTDLDEMAGSIGTTVEAHDPLLLTGVAMAVVGLAFKASVAPFHQWTPDVYQGAPTPVTAFMAVATKAAAFAILLRLFGESLIALVDDWAPALAALAVTTIVIGNVGAIGSRSLKRMLGWSGVAQAGYMLAGVVVGTRLGLQATVFYLAGYLVMNMAAFAVIVARERVTEHGDDIASLEGLGRSSPWLAWPMTIAMLALAGFPATVGFIGKFYLIDAAVDGDYAWLGVAIVVGSMISLVYYLRVVATMWMGPVEIDIPAAPGGPRRVRPVAGWSPEADARAQPEVTFVAVLCAAATVVLGVVPGPLFDVARDVGTSLSGLL